MKYIAAILYEDEETEDMADPEDFFQTIVDSVETDGTFKVIQVSLVDE